MKSSTSTPADDDTDEPSVQRIVPAHTAPPPVTSAANSVFDAGRKAKAALRPPAFDLTAVTIRHNVPKPSRGGTHMSRYRDLIARMAPGDSVDLPLRQAHGLIAQSKKDVKPHGPTQKFSFRKTSETHASVWRDA